MGGLLTVVLLGALFGAVAVFSGFLVWFFATEPTDQGYWMIIWIPIVLAIAFGFFTVGCAVAAGWWSAAIIAIDTGFYAWIFRRFS